MIRSTKELHSKEYSMDHLHEVCGQQCGKCWLWAVRTWHLTHCYDSHTPALTRRDVLENYNNCIFQKCKECVSFLK
jgi:hypothetical protein